MNDIRTELADLRLQNINNLIRLSSLKLDQVVAPNNNITSIQSNYKSFCQLDNCLMDSIRKIL